MYSIYFIFCIYDIKVCTDGNELYDPSIEANINAGFTNYGIFISSRVNEVRESELCLDLFYFFPFILVIFITTVISSRLLRTHEVIPLPPYQQEWLASRIAAEERAAQEQASADAEESEDIYYDYDEVKKETMDFYQDHQYSQDSWNLKSKYH